MSSDAFPVIEVAAMAGVTESHERRKCPKRKGAFVGQSESERPLQVAKQAEKSPLMLLAGVLRLGRQAANRVAEIRSAAQSQTHERPEHGPVVTNAWALLRLTLSKFAVATVHGSAEPLSFLQAETLENFLCESSLRNLQGACCSITLDVHPEESAHGTKVGDAPLV